ncbi:MAG TPA: anaerobic ribonucleoside-triphosphate reductase activating protein [Candidatus Paceibacterota bacterium]
MKIGGLEECTLIDYPGKIACVIYTIGCNFRCPYCHNPELVDETAKEMPIDKIWRFLEERKNLLDGVVISGGEPTLHDDLMEMILKIKKMGYFVKLDTNGTRPAIIKKLIGKNLLDYIAMDIKSPIEMYSMTVGRSVHPDAIRQSIEVIMSSPVDYEFRTTIVKSLLSPEDIEQIGKEIKGAKKYYLQKFNAGRVLSPQFKRKTTYTDEEFAQFKKMLLNYVKYCGIR